jgi:alkanesulfonate monooxygenase SsuD/methylene tetrahydromethanopterin reductase-like flavin-dependent oxidoreductase (luciferase family)
MPAARRAIVNEPLTMLSALSVVTQHIGLIATVSTTFNEPYNLARKFASLDHLSGGRSGWNLLTSSTESEAHNFSFEQHPAHAGHRSGDWPHSRRGAGEVRRAAGVLIRASSSAANAEVTAAACR